MNLLFEMSAGCGKTRGLFTKKVFLSAHAIVLRVCLPVDYSGVKLELLCNKRKIVSTLHSEHTNNLSAKIYYVTFLHLNKKGSQIQC